MRAKIKITRSTKYLSQQDYLRLLDDFINDSQFTSSEDQLSPSSRIGRIRH